jgi:hypothetical protein
MIPELAPIHPEASSLSGSWQPSPDGSFVFLAWIVSFRAEEPNSLTLIIAMCTMTEDQAMDLTRREAGGLVEDRLRL